MKVKDLCVLLKCASSLCDMRCTYCFYRDEASHRDRPEAGLMSRDTASVLISRALDHASGSCSFIFQGGEPTLAGLDFFRWFTAEAERQNAGKLIIHYSIQTNGQRIDREWAGFFRDSGFLVGLSIDGPREKHDRLRGEGTHKKVMQAASVLKSCGVPFNVVTVVTRENAKNPAALYDFFKRNGIFYQQYIPCLDLIDGESTLSSEEYGRFLISLFRLWAADAVTAHPVSIRYFDELMLMLLGDLPGSCGMSGRCGVQYVAEADGSIYPCDFYCLDDHFLGNVREMDFAAMDTRRAELGFIRASETVAQECRVCPWYGLCRGGCRRDRDRFDGSEPGLNRLCEAYRMFFSACGRDMVELAKKLK